MRPRWAFLDDNEGSYWIENYNGHKNNSTYKYLVSQNKGDGSPVFQYSLTASDSWWSLIG